jgi:uncharacterized membrane protein
MAKGNPSWSKDRELLYILIYMFGLFSGIVAYVLSGDMKDPKEAEKVRFNSVQAAVLGIIVLIVALIPFIGVLSALVWLFGLYVGYSAGKDSEVRIPYLGDFARMLK